MSQFQAYDASASATGTEWGTTGETRHSKEDSISERQFERLFRETHDLEGHLEFDTRFVLMAATKLGLRAGEIAHLSADWIDWSAKTIEIPEHRNCTKGSDGGVCGYCREMAERRLRANNLTIDEAVEQLREEFDGAAEGADLREMAISRRDEVNMTYEAAIEERWKPKTKNSVRSVPFDFDVRVEMCIEEFDRRWDEYPRSRCTVNRRVNDVVEAAGLDGRIYPHSLRATAASLHASRGVSPYALMSIMGWNDIQTARNYIQASSATAAKEIRSKHR